MQQSTTGPPARPVSEESRRARERNRATVRVMAADGGYIVSSADGSGVPRVCAGQGALYDAIDEELAGRAEGHGPFLHIHPADAIKAVLGLIGEAEHGEAYGRPPVDESRVLEVLQRAAGNG